MHEMYAVWRQAEDIHLDEDQPDPKSSEIKIYSPSIQNLSTILSVDIDNIVEKLSVLIELYIRSNNA